MKFIVGVIVTILLMAGLVACSENDPLLDDIYTEGNIFVWDGDSWEALAPAGDSLFDANSFLYALLDNTPEPKTPTEVLIILSGQAGTAFSMNSQSITNLDTPTTSTDAATKEYVDLAVTVLGWDYYFNDTASGIGAYFEMAQEPTGDPESTFTSAPLGAGDNQSLFQWISDDAVPFVTIDSGVINIHIHAQRTIGNRSIVLYTEIYEYTIAPAEVLIATTELSAPVTNAKAAFSIHASLPTDYEIASTSKLLVKFYANLGTGAPTTIALYAEGTTSSRVAVPIPSSSLNEIYVRLNIFDANTILKADADNTPIALVVAPSRLVGRTAAGNIDDLTGAEVLAILSGQAGAAFDWGGQNLTNLGDLTTLGSFISSGGGQTGKFLTGLAGNTVFSFSGSNFDIRAGSGSSSSQNVMRVTSAGDFGIGTNNPDTKLEILNVGNQLKLSFDGTDNAIFAVDTNGVLTITPSGTAVDFASKNLTGLGTLSAFTLGGTMDVNSQALINVLNLDLGTASTTGTFDAMLTAANAGTAWLIRSRDSIDIHRPRLGLSGGVDTAVWAWVNSTHTGLVLSGALTLSDTLGINTGVADDDYFTIGADDTGVGIVEVARAQGAADPYFSMGGTQQFRFYRSGYALFDDFTLNGAISDGVDEGAAGEVLTSNGVGAIPTWQAGGGGGANYTDLDGSVSTTAAAEGAGDGAWADWDLSGTLPVGTTAADIIIRKLVATDSVGVRTNGSALAREFVALQSQLLVLTVKVGADRIIEIQSDDVSDADTFSLIGYLN